jgi:diguanylate cyclase (GGDEF)-like protein
VLVCTAILYFVADTLLNKVALGDGWQIFWPLNGVTIALLISHPRAQWPALLTAVSIGTGAGEYLDGNAFSSMLVQRALSVLEVYVSASLLPRFHSLETWLRQPRLYPRFAAAVVSGPTISGLLAATYFHYLQGSPYVAAFNSWALADAMGIAAVLPLALALRSPEARSLLSRREWLKTVLTLAAAILVMLGIFMISHYPLIFVLYPLLMLVDWMLGLFGSSIALCCACVLMVFLTEHGYGPFAKPAELGMSRDLAVQLYLGFHLLGFLPISILFLERRGMEQELRASLARTSALAALDGLTGIANRRSLDEYLNEQWQVGALRKSPLALIMIDADHFKEFNDRLGHQAGDDCLRAIASALSAVVTRPGDVVARFGGEEFVALLPDTPLDGARRVGEMLRSAVFELAIAHPGAATPGAAHVEVEPQRVTVTVGCAAMIPSADTSYRQLVKMADEALYLAKRDGRNRVGICESETEIWLPGMATKKLWARIEAFKHQRARARLR